MDQSPNFVGRVAKVIPLAKRINNKEVDWDRFSEDSSSEEEPKIQVNSEPEPPKPIALRKADPRDRDNFRPLRGTKDMEIAQELNVRPQPPGEWHSREKPITHMSSDGGLKRQSDYTWEREMRAGRFHGAQAISSDDLFPEEEWTFNSLTGKLLIYLAAEDPDSGY